MKAKILFLGVCLMFFGMSKSLAQNNLTVAAPDSSPGDSNVRIGYQTGAALTSGSKENILIGTRSGQFNTDGDTNTCVGYQSGKDIGLSVSTPGYSNTFFGATSGQGCTSGYYNTAIGVNSGNGVATGHHNTFLGQNSGFYTTGENNVILGSATGNSSLNNNIVLSDGGGLVRMIFTSGGYAGIQLVGYNMPTNTLEIGTAYAVNGTAGLKFRNWGTDARTPVTNTDSEKGILSVDADGDVIMVTDQVGSTNSCTTQYNVPTTAGNTNGNLACGQIYDNGTSVSIGTALTTTSAITYNLVGSGYGVLQAGSGPPDTGNVRLDVNGITRAVAFFATSDERFKKNIKPITNSIEIVNSLQGKTYKWNNEGNKNIQFDNGAHSGFIAQEIEKVLPHLVATDATGMKSVNYMEILPYLVEAIKEQQTQIEELKSQITENFKAQNAELINLGNTKIISVSPNPSKDMISVSFNVEKSVSSAKLLVHDLNGNVLSNLTINDRDNNLTRTLQKDNFGAGIYIVSLVINGKSVDTKKIVFN